MEKAAFIFSDERKYRIGRHLAFWVFWWLFMAFLYAFIPFLFRFDVFTRFCISAIDSLFFLTLHIFLSYVIMYFIIPNFLLKQRYWYAAFFTLLSFIITGFFSTVINRYIILPVHRLLHFAYVDEKTSLYQINFLSLLAGLRGGITVAGIAAAIKLSKYWYIKEQRNLQLQKENIESQLTILKAQVHPHFLFNTLNNIYSLTLTKSQTAPVVVSHLSDLLRYMLYECNDREVSLDNEIEALRKYVELEKLRYGNRIEVSFVCSGHTKDLRIAPLLLLPFIENSFKHGVSRQLDQCWVNLHIHADDAVLTFNLSNSYTNDVKKTTTGGLGLQNIKKRLELLYPGRYDLNINEANEIFNIKLVLQLHHAEEQLLAKNNELIHFKPVPAI
ncbi:MAG: sensor histidine kinase [Sphingobacteriales bacterium]